VDSLHVPNGRDLTAEARISVVVHGGDAAKKTGPVALFTVPPMMRALGPNGAGLLARMANDPPRRFPIDASMVMGPGSSESDLRLTLPEGWKAQLPKGVVATSPFGDYRSEYTQDGRTLHVSRRVTGATGVYPKEKIDELKAWLKKLADDNLEAIVLTLPPTP
jgi:hypothetical protein